MVLPNFQILYSWIPRFLFSGCRSVDTNISGLEVETSGIEVLRARIHTVHLGCRVSEVAKSNVLPRDVDPRAGHVDDKKQVICAVIPQTSIHILVVVVCVCGSWVDEERLDHIFDENSQLSGHGLDRRGVATRGWVTE